MTLWHLLELCRSYVEQNKDTYLYIFVLVQGCEKFDRKHIIFGGFFTASQGQWQLFLFYETFSNVN